LTLAEHLVGVTMELGLSDIRAAAAGDAAAFARIVATHHREMARVAFVITGDADDAQDAVQTAWTIAWRRLGSHRENASLRAWLLKIAANEARQSIRRDHRRALREVPVDALGGDPIDGTRWDPGSHVDLARSLARLDPDDRALLALRFAADLDSTEIARMTGGSPSGVRSRLSRLLHRLREDLTDV
jgi:RNA polymerase sigma-70 factor (ECF subfamily)